MFRMLATVIELSMIIILLLIVAKELVIPMATNKPLFPTIRNWNKKEEN